ncbi:MAG: hypothetical protein QOJ68_2037 [Blastococcus sp.]|nr:hypothetical protein [Blastococcus sp.]
MDEDSRFFEILRRILDDLDFPESIVPAPVPRHASPQVRPRGVTRWPLRTPVAAVLVLLLSVLLARWRP